MSVEANQDFIANVAVLEEELRREVEYNLFWSKFTGDVKQVSNDLNEGWQPSGQIIENFTRPPQANGDNRLIPFLKNLIGDGVYGDGILSGTGEDMDMRWLRAYCNQLGKAVMKKRGNMEELRAELYKLYDKAKPLLSDWWATKLNIEIFRAFYAGVSRNLSIGKASEGLGVYKRYHPNFYYHAGSGTLTAIGTEGKTKTASELDSAVSSANGNNITCDALHSLRTLVIKLKIQPLETEQGHEFWPLILNSDQLASLKGIQEYQDAQKSAYTSKMLDSPLLNGFAGYFDGFAIKEENIGTRGWDTSNDQFFTDSFSTNKEYSSITTNVCGIVLGKSAVGNLHPEKLHFTKEVSNHERQIEIGGSQIYGYNRADFTDEDDAGESSGLFQKDGAEGTASATEVENTSSLILMTDEN